MFYLPCVAVGLSVMGNSPTKAKAMKGPRPGRTSFFDRDCGPDDNEIVSTTLLNYKKTKLKKNY